MNLGFWGKLKKPIFALAPMADVTDFAFREIIAKCGSPDVFFTEFVSADGLISKGQENLLINLKFSRKQKPIVAQIFSSQPKNCRKAAEIIEGLGFQGIDINMGCPHRKVERQGAGAALIKNSHLAREIILETKKGTKLPISIKTRVGYSKNELSSWLPYIFETEPALITIHARTRSEMSKVPAKWEHIREAVELRDKYFRSREKPLILGNGDVLSIEDGKDKADKYGADGVMIGRAVLGNPWVFAGISNPPVKKRLKTLIKHAEIFDKSFKNKKNFNILKKHFKAYVSGFHGAKELRSELMRASSVGEIKKIIKRHGF